MADSSTPYAGESPQRLTDLINSDNGTSLQLGVDFTFGPPSAYSDRLGRNTKVSMIPVPGSPWTHNEVIHYTRLALTVLNDLPSGWVKAVEIQSVPFTLSGMLQAINEALGLNLSVDEIVDTVYDNAQGSYRLPINNAASLAWIDSEFSFKATFPGGDIPLSSAIVNSVLSGLTYLQPSP